MSDVVGIRFKTCGKIYDFEASDLDLKWGDAVVVESDLGLSIGSVVRDRRPSAGDPKELKKVLRVATEDDFRQKKENETFEADAAAYCRERIMARGLPMKLLHAEATLDKKRIIFYFVADGRIDFRELVKDLAAKFRTRIEMRQIGVRDQAKAIGAIGICGRELCCKTFLTSFEPISIKMAKSQELVLNASKLSGVCGRLMCCLSYEYIEGDEQGTQDDTVTVPLESEDEVLADVVESPPADLSERAPEPRAKEAGPITPPPAATAQDSPEARSDREGGAPPEGKTESAGSPAASGKRFHKRRRRHRRRFHK